MYRYIVLFMIMFNLSFSKTLIDGMGRTVKIDKKVQRVISTVPSNTEIIVEMGLTDKLVGVDIYSEKVSPELKGLGFFNTDSLNEEKILELNPDLVITSTHSLFDASKSLKMFEKLEIPVFVVSDISELEEVLKSVDEIGALFDEPQKANILKEHYSTELKKIKETTKDIKNRKSIYFEIVDQPNYTAGGDTLIDTIIETAGGINIFHDEKGWISPPLEKIIEKNPDIILVGKDREKTVESIRNRKEWQDINAVKNGRVYSVDEGINRPSTRVLKSLIELQEILKMEEKK